MRNTIVIANSPPSRVYDFSFFFFLGGGGGGGGGGGESAFLTFRFHTF